MDTLQSTGFISSNFNENGIGSVVDVIYDSENGYVFYLDTFGNIYIATYGSQMLLLNIFAHYEVLSKQATTPLGFMMDFTLN